MFALFVVALILFSAGLFVHQMFFGTLERTMVSFGIVILFILWFEAASHV